jgi:hypothetical protein
MSKVIKLDDGWKAMEVAGLGVIVQAEMGLIFVEYAKIDEAGGLVAMEMPAVAAPEAAPKPNKGGPTSMASVNVKAFLDGTVGKNFGGGGEYGPFGAHLKRLREVLQTVDPESEQGTLWGNFLAMGDHTRYGVVAAVIGLKPAALDELSQILASPEPDLVETFVDRVVTGAA